MTRTEREKFREDYERAKRLLRPLGGRVTWSPPSAEYEAFRWRAGDVHLVFYAKKDGWSLRVRDCNSSDTERARLVMDALPWERRRGSVTGTFYALGRFAGGTLAEREFFRLCTEKAA